MTVFDFNKPSQPLIFQTKMAFLPILLPPQLYLAKEGDGEGGGRDDLGEEEEEHGEREQDGDGQGHLLAGVWGTQPR